MTNSQAALIAAASFCVGRSVAETFEIAERFEAWLIDGPQS